MRPPSVGGPLGYRARVPLAHLSAWVDLTAVESAHDRDCSLRAKAFTELIEPALEVNALAAPKSMSIDLVAAHLLALDNICPCHAFHRKTIVDDQPAANAGRRPMY